MMAHSLEPSAISANDSIPIVDSRKADHKALVSTWSMKTDYEVEDEVCEWMKAQCMMQRNGVKGREQVVIMIMQYVINVFPRNSSKYRHKTRIQQTRKIELTIEAAGPHVPRRRGEGSAALTGEGASFNTMSLGS